VGGSHAGTASAFELPEDPIGRIITLSAGRLRSPVMRRPLPSDPSYPAWRGSRTFGSGTGFLTRPDVDAGGGGLCAGTGGRFSLGGVPSRGGGGPASGRSVAGAHHLAAAAGCRAIRNPSKIYWARHSDKRRSHARGRLVHIRYQERKLIMKRLSILLFVVL